MEEPCEPLLTDYTASATSLAMLRGEDRNSFRWDYERYERKLIELRKKVQVLADLNLEIGKNISKKRTYIIQNCETAYERLVALNKHLAPDVVARRHEIIEKYNNLKSAPNSLNKLEHWLSEWTQPTSMGNLMNLPETDGFRPEEDFLISCKALETKYATSCLCDIYKAENDGTVDLLSKLDDYVVEFTAFLRRKKSNTSEFSTAASELKMAKHADDKTGCSKSNRRNGKPVPKCLCGENNWYSECFVMNEEHPSRPADFSPSQTAREQVSAARSDPKVETRIQDSLQRWRRRQEKHTGTLSIDDGQPPPTNETFTINISGKMTSEEASEENLD